MPNLADIFVGSVALILGAASLSVALFNLEAVFQLPKAEALQKRFGRSGARVCFAVIGLILVALGCVTLAGFAPNASGRGGEGAVRPDILTIPG